MAKRGKANGAGEALVPPAPSASPDSLQDSATAEALRAICELDLTELQAIVPPRGFGRD